MKIELSANGKLKIVFILFSVNISKRKSDKKAVVIIMAASI